MNPIFLLILFITFFPNCKQNGPCSPFDTSCNPLGYFLPDLIRPRTTGTVTFTGLSNLTILSATSVKLDWTAATSSTATGSIEYNIYSANTTGAQVFTTPLLTVNNVTTATITGIIANTNNYYVVRAKNSAGVTDTNTSERAALLNGLIRFIPLDAGSLATGEKIGNTLITAFGSPPLTGSDRKGLANNAYSFDGTNHYFTFIATGLPAGNSDRTVCAWGRYTNVLASRRLVSYGTDFAHQIIGLGAAPSPNVHIYVTTFATDESKSYVIAGDINLSNWNYFCYILRSPSFMSIYANGTPRIINFNQGSGTVNTIIGSAAIGAHNVTFADKLLGSTSELSIWNRALSEPELQAVFKN
jgi:hypothetical protein